MQRGTEDLRRCNVRLEAYLKRSLDVDAYERIRTHDSCIVCSEREDKAFKFVVVSDEWIYLTENPPKQLLKAIHFSDVTAMDILPDKPPFLSGLEKENCQHLLIKYLTDSSSSVTISNNKVSGSSNNNNMSARGSISSRTERSKISAPFSTTSRSPNSGRSSVKPNSSPDSARRNPSPDSVQHNPDSIWLEKKSGVSGDKKSGALSFTARYAARSDALPSTARSLNQSISLPSSARFADQSASLPTSARQLLVAWYSNTANREGTESGGVDEGGAGGMAGSEKEGGVTSRSTTSEKLSNFFRLTARKDINNAVSNSSKKDVSESARSAGASSVSDGARKDVISKLPESARSQSAKSASAQFQEKLGDKDSKLNDSENETNISVGKKKRKRNRKVDIDTTARAHDDDDDDDTIPPLDLGAITDSATSRNASPTHTTRYNDDVTVGDDIDAAQLLRTAQIHLYILRPTSAILMLLRCAWRNYLVRATLELDPLYVQRSRYFPPRSGPGISEKLERLFAQLKTELLSPHKNEAEAYQLVLELKLACARNFIIKRFFWKTGEIFEWMVREIKRCTDGSRASSRNTATPEFLKSTAIAETSLDRIEYLILLIETLTSLFYESDMFTSRTQCVKVNDGRVLIDLIHSLIYLPGNGVRESNHEMRGLEAELTARCTELLCELLEMCNQSHWADTELSWLKIHWIIAQLEQRRDECMKLVDRLVEQAMLFISTNQEPARLQPDEAVLLYRQCIVLDSLTHNSDLILNHIKQKYLEEFKYYIHMTVIEQQIPRPYLIRTLTLKSIKTLTHRILAPLTTLKHLAH